MKFLFNKTIKTNKIISSVVLLAILFSGFSFVGVHKTNAWFGAADTVVEVGLNAWVNKITSVVTWISAGLDKITSAAVYADYIKEYFLDPAMWLFAKGDLKALIESNIDWVREGAFSGALVPMLGTSNGGPLFITDLKKLLFDGSWQGGGIFIHLFFDPNLNDCLPEPWRAPVGRSLVRDRKNIVAYKFDCSTLLEGISTIDGMGEFMNMFYNLETKHGGWDAWLSLFDSPTNLPMGMYDEYTNEMESQASAAQDQLRSEALMDNGFIGKKICAPDSIIETAPAWTGIGPLCTKWITETPGSFVKNLVDEHSTSELRSFENADELSEMIFALFESITSSLFNEGGTLLGNNNVNSYDPWQHGIKWSVDTKYDYNYGCGIGEIAIETNGVITCCNTSDPEGGCFMNEGYCNTGDPASGCYESPVVEPTVLPTPPDEKPMDVIVVDDNGDRATVTGNALNIRIKDPTTGTGRVPVSLEEPPLDRP
ncbi:hypothetical protein ACFLY5_00660 [Patescibacteria group bacterium]